MVTPPHHFLFACILYQATILLALNQVGKRPRARGAADYLQLPFLNFLQHDGETLGEVGQVLVGRRYQLAALRAGGREEKILNRQALNLIRWMYTQKDSKTKGSRLQR